MSAAGAIKAIYSGIDFTKDGINEVAIGRDTGSLEVYGFDQRQQPVLVFQASVEESISTIDGGFFTSPNVQVVPLLPDVIQNALLAERHCECGCTNDPGELAKNRTEGVSGGPCQAAV